MKFEVMNRWSGKVAFTAEIEAGDDTPFSIKLGLAVKWAVKSRANLYGANLSGANLYGAHLSGANLYGAHLSGAKGINPYVCTPLLMLLDQPGKIRAYKLVNEKHEGIYNGGLKYKVGKSVSVKDANTDQNEQCGAGINVATLDWCIKEWREGLRILLVEFEASQIACIPTATDGKFRLHACDILSEVDLEKIGVVKPQEAKAA
jgi:hypothetical protein